MRPGAFPLAGTLLLFATLLPAQAPDRDALVARAIQGALLDEPTMVRVAAGGLRVLEEQAGEKPRTAGAAEALARVTASDSVPTGREVRRAVRRRERSGVTESVERIAASINLQDRFADARASRRYEARRQVVNSVTGAVASVFQLQFFGLIQPPLDAIDYAFVKRHYVSPEERRELAVAREILDGGGILEHERAARLVERRAERWERTYALQARRNGEEAARRGHLTEAAWWYARERSMRGAQASERSAHVALSNRLLEIEEQRQRIVTVRSAESGEWRAEEADAIRYLLGDADAVIFSAWQLDGTERALLRAVDSPRGPARFNALRDLAREGDSDWAARATLLLERPQEDPAAAVSEAKTTVRRRIQSYLLAGKDPTPGAETFTPEEARQVESALIERARALFVIDVLSRALTYPLLPGRVIDRREIPDATAMAGTEWQGTEVRRRALDEAARVYRKSRRFERAARTAEEAGRFERAESLRNRRARELRRALRREDVPARRVELATRLLNAHTEYAERRDIAERIERDLVLAPAWFSISRRDLRRHPELTEWGALGLSRERLRRGRREGRVARDGVHLLPAARIAWVDRRTHAVHVRELDETAWRNAVARWMALDRTRSAREALDAPRERKRIPLALEGSALPGITVAPGLVPLDPDPDTRRLYE